MFEEALRLIRDYDRIIIHRHNCPDGDAIGSQTGLKFLIEANFPDKKVFIVGDAPKKYSFMEGSTPDSLPDSTYEGALAVVLDTSARSLISDERYSLASETLRIDHHIFCEKICSTEITDTTYESCCGMIADLARETGLRLTASAARALFTGMVTDSGRFRYDSTNARTFELAAYLMGEDFSTADIYSKLYSESFENIKLRASFILKIKFTEKGVAYIYTTADEMKALGADTFSISRGMVGTMSDIRGVDIWVNFTEIDGAVLCEIRSSKYNINPIAVKHGGGGHAKASGATLKNREEAFELLSELDSMTEEKQ